MPLALPLTRRATLGALALALLTSGCAVVEPRADHWRPPPLGASWGVAPTSHGSSSGNGLVRFTRGEGIWRAFLGPQDHPVKHWNPPLGFEYPLTVGKFWLTHEEMPIGDTRAATDYDRACAVQDHEKLAVRARTAWASLSRHSGDAPPRTPSQRGPVSPNW